MGLGDPLRVCNSRSAHTAAMEENGHHGAWALVRQLSLPSRA